MQFFKNVVKVTQKNHVALRHFVFVLQLHFDNGYKSPQSAALAITKLFPEDERPQKVILDIGAGTGLVADEVCFYSVADAGS
jgi:predicted TPR repeat methyltransferase